MANFKFILGLACKIGGKMFKEVPRILEAIKNDENEQDVI